MTHVTLCLLILHYSYVLQLTVRGFDSITIDNMSNHLDVYNDYVLLASDVQDWSCTASVFIIFGGNDQSMPVMSFMLHLLREFSRKRVLVVTANYTQLLSVYRRYYKRIVQPMILVLLSSDKDVASFHETTRTYDMSYSQWLIIFMNSSENCQTPGRKTFHLKFDTRMLVKCGNDRLLREWWSVDYGAEVSTYDLALWDPKIRFQLLTNMTLYERRHSIDGKFFRVATSMESPFVASKWQWHSSSHGPFEKIVYELSRSLNFTYKIVYKELDYGAIVDGAWTGIIGRVAADEADIGVAELTMTAIRMNVVDFSLPLILSRNRLYFRQPRGTFVQWYSYSKAFNFDIWVILGVIQIIAVISITIIRMNLERKTILSGYMSENYLAVWGTFCQQGLSEYPASTPLRIAYFSLFTLSLVILAIYSACLISYLTLTTPGLPFKDLQGFLKSGNYRLLAVYGTSDYNMFTHTTDVILKKIGKLLVDTDHLPKTVMDGFQRVCDNPRRAFHATEAMKEQLYLWLPCNLLSINTGRFDSLGMVLTKGSPYTGIINYQLQKFKDCGIMSRLKQTYFTDGTNNNGGGSTEYQPVSLNGIVPLIAVILVGIAIAAVVFCLELLFYRCTIGYRQRLQRHRHQRLRYSCTRRINALKKALIAYENYHYYDTTRAH